MWKRRPTLKQFADAFPVLMRYGGLGLLISQGVVAITDPANVNQSIVISAAGMMGLGGILKA